MTTPMPANFNTVILRGTYISFDGAPLDGKITFTPSVNFLISGSAQAVLLAKPIIGVLAKGQLKAADGVSDLKLFATDDTDVNPTGWKYHVKEEIGTGAGRPVYDISVPVAAMTSGLNIYSMGPTPTVS